MNEEGKEQLEETAELVETVETEDNYGDDSQKESSDSGYEREEIHSSVVRAGKRTYFFDVKATRNGDYYLTITESKKRFNKNGRYYFEKHKIFLYKEDFDKFTNALNESVNFIKEEKPEQMENLRNQYVQESEEFTNVDFDDLDNNKA